MTSAAAPDAAVPAFTFELEPDKVLEQKIFVRLSAADAAGPAKLFDFNLVSSDGAIHATTGAKFETPGEASK